MWLFTGILIGLGISYYLWAKGYIPDAPIEQPVANTEAQPRRSESALADEVKNASEEPEKSRYDFFTVLPEMEVVVPEQELSEPSAPGNSTADSTDRSSYVLQVGSFQSSADAEQRKARLALLGILAQIQTVKVNESTWHRVRVGPVAGARGADDLRHRLTENGIDSLVMKNP
jgi:cell division protein FtsN